MFFLCINTVLAEMEKKESVCPEKAHSSRVGLQILRGEGFGDAILFNRTWFVTFTPLFNRL